MLTDKASTTINVWKALGFALSTVIGGALYDLGGYEFSCDFMALFTLGTAILYAISMYFISKDENKYKDLFKKYEMEADREYMIQVI